MNDFAAWLIRWSARIALMLVALVFLLCLLVASSFLMLFWALRVLWARLTGRPAAPWPGARSGWHTVYRSGAQWMAQSGFHKPSARASRCRGADITDVQPREVREH